MYLNRLFYLLMTAVILVIALGFALPPLFTVGKVLLALLVVAVVADVGLLYNWWPFRHSQSVNRKSDNSKPIGAFRTMAERFSNGDENPVKIRVESNYGFRTDVEVIDEIPFVFQRRDVCFKARIGRMGDTTIIYKLTPTERGVYGFGHVRVFVSSPLRLVQRRFTCCEPQQVKVYPSYLMLRQYELLAMSNNLTEMGIKRIRRIGHNTDFEQIKDYVVGDDYRTINWRATARRSHLSPLTPHLMVNVYQEERSQRVFCVIDKGRMMQQTFRPQTSPLSFAEGKGVGLTLLDYSINAALVLSFVAVNKQDKAGLITFSTQMETFVPASRQPGHLQTLQEALYAEKAVFGETDYSALLAGLTRHVSHRSLLVLFTSFTSMPALRRQLPFLRQLAMRHRLLVVFFEDEELKQFTAHPSPLTAHPSPLTPHPFKTTEAYYQRIIAEKFAYEQRLIVNTLRQYGIQSLLTTPANLSVNVINKYLEIK
ncbi:MAG: DUF58 domain-containing protein [Prevotella sp.]|nr:DUF58 domain-containing protein [Prevotella sp.]